MDTVLATATRMGRPSVRVIRTLHTDDGFEFLTDVESRKAVELADNPHAALMFYWPIVAEQVQVVGVVEPLDEDGSDRLFRTVGRAGKISAWASRQDRPMVDRDRLETARSEADARYAATDVPRPPWRRGYRLVPTEWEFWLGRDDRLHDRTIYTRTDDGWRLRRVQP